jgi:phosphoglycolate phosphatase-like HAD superfamily hydrolase
VSIEGAHGVVFDVDDTLIQGSGETIHDGAGGRFRGGINLALRALGRPEITPEVWEAQHRGISGSNETDVIRLHALLAGIEPEELTQCQELWWRANLPSIINQTTLLDGLPELLEDLSARKIARAVCSASSLDIVKAMLKLKGVWDHIEYGLGWAGKRVGPGRYCGIPYEQTCRIIGLSPSDVVMVGDSIADMATQRLGIARSSSPRPHGHGPISVLISPNHEQLHGKMLEIEAFHRTHPESVTEHGIIFVAHSARQLRFGAKEGPLRWLVGPSDSPALRPESLP